MGYYMSEYFQNFDHLIKIYIQCTIQNSQTSEQFCCLLYDDKKKDFIVILSQQSLLLLDIVFPICFSNDYSCPVNAVVIIGLCYFLSTFILRLQLPVSSFTFSHI